MFYGKFADKGNNLVDNPNIYNVEGDNKLSPSLQPLTTGSVLKICVVFVSVRFRSCIFYIGNYCSVYYKTKQLIFVVSV